MTVKVEHGIGRKRPVIKVFDNWEDAKDYLRTLTGTPLFFWLKAESEDGLRFSYGIDSLSEYCNSDELLKFLIH